MTGTDKKAHYEVKHTEKKASSNVKHAEKKEPVKK
jgi:hypothetical protein